MNAWKEAMNTYNAYEQKFMYIRGSALGIHKPPFPVTVSDPRYNKKYYLLNLNAQGIDTWIKVLTPQPLPKFFKPLIDHISMNTASEVDANNLYVVTLIFLLFVSFFSLFSFYVSLSFVLFAGLTSHDCVYTRCFGKTKNVA